MTDELKTETEHKISRRDAVDSALFSEKSATQWLLGKSSDKPNLSTPTTKGPGKLRKLQAITGEPDCFITKNPEINQGKKKILIPQWGGDEPPLGKIAIISELIENYEVYLWEGPEKNLAAASPLTSAADFWKQREKIKIDYTSNIKKHLAK